MRQGVFSRFALLLAVVFFAAGLSSCGQQQQDASVSSIDSTLAMGDFSEDVPESEMTPGEEFNPPPEAPPVPPPAPKRTPPPPPPKPAPPATATLPAGTSLSLTLSTPLTTKTAQIGDTFAAVLTEPIILGNRVAIPAGTVVYGHVAATHQPGKLSGRGMMQLAFDSIEFEERRYNVASVGDTIWGKGGAAKDAGLIAGGAAAGAIVGKILGGSAGKGAVVGGAAGTAASMLTRGPQLELEAGAPINFTLEKPVTVTQPKLGA
jgi:hypothetical protein